MNITLFAFQMKPRLKRLLPGLMACFLLGAAAIWLFLPERVSDLALLRQELPEVMTALGYFGSATLGIHVSGVLLMLVLPLSLAFYSISQAEYHVGDALRDGRMAQLLAAPHRRSAILLTLCLCAFLETALLLFAAFLGQVLLAVILFAPLLDVLALFRLNLGLLLVCLPFSGLSLLMLFLVPQRKKRRRLCRTLFLLSFLGLGASRFPGWTRFLRFLSPISLLKPQEALASFAGLMQPLWGLALALAFVLFALSIFQQHDL